ncbi:Uma2 family endonuclease [Sulfurihydrogenibium azorense]|uniref:Uma2 family endonuclease n=1 Tax=Sulfurihydrogenibium azorense TaxID=309806 RepID=UPI00240994F0|nr:Uma2 family endonuclease [Sulfurihydrogenibium azorense]MDM7273128.1 Uma2 family endonuclease [Sulfurihydrogenibium azorense]
MKVSTKEKLLNKKKTGIPRALIYEMRYGSPIYYRDYDKVLKGEIPLEAVMGSSGLQAWLIKIILKFLLKVLNKKYEVLSNEVGFKFAKKSWYNLDIAIWEKEKIKPYLKENKLIPVPPELVIEVDTKADLRKFENPQDYFHKKTQDLLNAGIKKVIWIFTQDKKVWIAQPSKPWLIVDWNYDIPVLDDLKMNIEKLIKEEEENE